MLIRFGGGVGGIKEYLEGGHKQGRGVDRDELDERVILAGDLEAIDALIDSMEVSGEKYLHVTLAFKEDEISRETLDAIVRDFEKFAFAAYRQDEYAFYAEAHMPRLQSYESAQTGELVERKPHIHIVIPKLNLLSGGHLNPFGMVAQNTEFIDAFQEHVNEKYGLASPKDNRRIEFTGESEMISRYKGDLFDAQGKDIKSKVLDALLERDIQRYEDFVALLREFGEHRTRNAGRADQYENLKVEGAAKGLNFKDFVFRRDFIELSAEDKRTRLAAELRPKYELAGAARPSSPERLATLQAWHDTRSREVKYLNGPVRRVYREADAAGRQAILNEREQRFYAKHEHHQEVSDAGRPDFGRSPLERQPWERDYPFKGQEADEHAAGGRRPDRQRDLAAAPSLAEAESLDGLRDLSSGGVDGDGVERAVLLPGDAPRELVHAEAERADALRRRDPGAGRGAGRVEPAEPEVGRPVNAPGQLLQDLQEQRRAKAAEEAQAWRDLKHQIDVGGLLVDLAASHGVVPDKYVVSKGADGADRVRCGTRQLNVSDFLTRELHLPWKEAERIMREAHARQQLQRGADPHGRVAPSAVLWREFMRQERDGFIDRAAMRHQHRLAGIKDRAAITKAFQMARTKAGVLAPKDRRAQISIARMQRVVAEAELRERLRVQRLELRAQARRPDFNRYRDYLQARAQAGDEAALRELRRHGAARSQAIDFAPNGILDGGQDALRRSRSALYTGQGLTFTVERNGDVTYKLGGSRVIRDTARKIDVLVDDSRTLETALRLAQQKFGSGPLTLTGSRRFQEKVAAAAAENRVLVKFTDERLNAVMRARRAELDAANKRSPDKGPDRG